MSSFQKFIEFVESLDIKEKTQFEADFGKYRGISSQEGVALIKSKMSYLNLDAVAQFFAYRYSIVYTPEEYEKFKKFLTLFYYM